VRSLVFPSLIASIVFPLLLVLHILCVGSLGRSGPALSKQEMKRHLVWRAFYVNPADPRGWVPKTHGSGWTVNFRSMNHVYTIVALITAVLVSSGIMTSCAFGCAG
jgi:uncharacterized membrane protein